MFIVSNDPRLAAYAASSPFGVIEYNGHDAFEFGAVGQVLERCHRRRCPTAAPTELLATSSGASLIIGPCQVTAKLDARPPPPGQRAEAIEALFTFQHLDQ